MPLPSNIEFVTSVEGITEYRLQNGLKVLLFPDPSKPVITVNITYLVGSRHEGYGETGMAHLLEHLVFKGTPLHPDIPQELTEHGARPNGTTWYDRTNYFETFSASDENLEWALELEADRMINSFIAKKDLDSEMTVVRNEFESGENDPMGIMEERALSATFLWHNYGKSTIGARADLENVPIERLQGFYRNYYQPDNAILLVAGMVDEQKTLELIDRFFSPIPRPSRRLHHTYTLDPTQDGERVVTLRRVGDVQGVISVYKVPAGSHPDFAAVDLLTLVLGDTPSGRLHHALVETKKASSVAGYNYQLREPSVMIFRAEVRLDSSLDEARELLIRTVEDMVSTPATDEEVERARSTVLKQFELTLNKSDRIGMELSEWSAMGDWRLFFLHRDRIRKVSAEEVRRVAAAYLKSSNRTVGLFIPTQNPDRAEIPATPPIAEMLEGYEGDAAVATGEMFDSSPKNIESRVLRSQLPNGMKIALLPKKTRGGIVVGTMTLRFGDESSLMHQATAAVMTSQMLMRGTARRSRQEIKDELDRLRARVSLVPASASELSISIETSHENVDSVLRLIAEILREPSFPVDQFEQLREEMLAATEEQRSDPESLAFTAVRRHLSPYPKGDVRYTSTSEEDIDDLTRAQVSDARKFYAQHYGASSAQLAVVGDLEGLDVAGLVLELFGNWSTPHRFERVPRPFRDVPAAREVLEVPDKANAVFYAGLNLNVRDDDHHYPALVLGNYMLGGGFLNSRLATRIRRNDGISYGVGSQLLASPLDYSGSFATFAIFAPENAARLEAAYHEELERMLKDGFSEEEVQAAKSGFLQGQQVSRSQDAELARKLATYLFIDRTMIRDEEFEKKIAALTPADILEAMRRHVEPERITIFRAGHFSKPAPAMA